MPTKSFENFLGESQENGPLAENRQNRKDRKCKRTRQKNRRGDRKGEVTALRFQTGRGDQTSLASHRGLIQNKLNTNFFKSVLVLNAPLTECNNKYVCVQCV